MDVPEPSGLSSTGGTGSGMFLMQQVATIRESIIKGSNWQELSEAQWESIFSVLSDATDKHLLRLADLYADDLSETKFDAFVS